MKILKVAGIVAGIHVFFLIALFVIPGCSSSTKPPPEPIDTVQTAAPAPTITMPAITPAPAAPAPLLTAGPTGFNPEAPASYADSNSAAVHFTPTRPNSAAASAVTAPPVTDVTPAATYSVKSGDSLWVLAKKNHLGVAELAAANNLRTSAVLHEGQKLVIPSKPGNSTAASSTHAAATPSLSSTTATATKSTDSTASTTKASADDLKHTVKSGETLGEIARKYGVKSKDIAVKNNITDPQKLRAGTELIIPGWNTPSSKSGRGASSSESSAARASSTNTTTPTTEPEAPPPPPTNSVPVIHIDDNPITPAPKS
jgi:LysM repeat protein